MLKLKLGPPDAKNWFIDKDPDAGKDWGQEKKGTTEDEIVGWHHWLYGHGFEQALEAGDGQGSLVCFSPWGHKELGMTGAAELTELKFANILLRIFFIDVLSRNWLFLVVLLSGFGIRVMKASLNEFGNISSPSILWKIWKGWDLISL